MTDKTKEIKNKLDMVYINREELQKLAIDKQGYAFDSLIYRFKDYQSKLFPFEIQEEKITHRLDEWSAREQVKSRHDRDLMRFIQILDEAIGEHS